MIPEHQKVLIRALTATYLKWTPEDGFKDFVQGKGRGVNFLIQFIASSLLARAVRQQRHWQKHIEFRSTQYPAIYPSSLTQEDRYRIDRSESRKGGTDPEKHL